MSEEERKSESGGNALQWFNSHPVVATVLWVLGADMRDNDSKIGDKRSTLSWRDDHGGRIVEYQESPSRSAAVTDRFTEYSDRNERISVTRNSDESPEHSGGHLLKRKDPQSANQDKNGDIYGEFEVHDSISPSWGFYVAITPPQEHYSRHTS